MVLADDLPSAETVLDNYVKATGGKSAYEKHHNMKVEATMEMPAQGIKASLTSYAAAPNLSRTVTEFPGLGKSEQGHDGEIFWSMSAMEGPRVMQGEEKDFMVRLNAYNAELRWQEIYDKIECTGTEDVDGKTCYKVVMTPATGSPVTNYFDKETGLLVRTDMIAKTPMGEMPIESRVEDYKEVDGQKVPFKTTQSFMGMKQIITMNNVEFNVELPENIFAPPAEIKALAAKQAESGKATADDTP